MRIIRNNTNQREYILQKELGRGSYGTVYYSELYPSKQPCAIKKIEVRAQYRHAIYNQVNILSQLVHPNIVRVFDIIEEQKTNILYMVMQYCQSDLSQFIKNHTISQNRAKQIIKQVASGLNYLYQRGVIHRDLKPANILVNVRNKDQYEFKLADFGLARYVCEYENSLLQTIAGTPLYMAPQILKRQPYTTKCDIWSAGIIFYQLLVRKLPWTAQTEKMLIQSIQKNQLCIPEDLSQWSKTLLRKMLVVNQQDRIGWQELFQIVNSPYYFKSNSRPKRPSSSESNKSARSAVGKQTIAFPTQKLKELLIIDMLQQFDESTVNKIIKDSQYKLNLEQSKKIKDLLSCYNLQLQSWFLKDIPSFRTCIA